ncbi:hypothetical protein P7C73_g3194, partial [Tremellales sp. Uapishka_1]
MSFGRSSFSDYDYQRRDNTLNQPALDRGTNGSSKDYASGYGSMQQSAPTFRQSQEPVFPSSGPTAKRGSKACAACRRGKNRCEGDPTGMNRSCRRCLLTGTTCVFDKPASRGVKTEGRGRRPSVASSVEAWNGDAEGRVKTLESNVQSLSKGQEQIHSALNQILAMLPKTVAPLPTPNTLPSFLPNHTDSTTIAPSNIQHLFGSITSPQSLYTNSSPAHNLLYPGLQQLTPTVGSLEHIQKDKPEVVKKEFPKLPGFAPPNHRFGNYGILPLSSAPPSPNHSRHSSRSSSSHSVTSSSALPRTSLIAPIQALQTLANAADQAAAQANGVGHDGENNAEDGPANRGVRFEDVNGDDPRGRSKKRKRLNVDGNNIHLRVRKKKKPDPTPRNPFPDVVTKGLVTEAEARELWAIFFSGCQYFVPLWDKDYDTYETFIERTPFSTNGLLAVAAKIRAGNEEAQGIARSTLFGPCVRKEAVMATLILSVWSQNGWLPSGHALRMGLDINIHRALDKLADPEESRTEIEERDLVVCARIWLNCYMHDHLISLGTGKPLLLRDDASVKKARILLNHPMASETDMRLIAGVELVNLRIRVIDHLTPLHGKVDTQTISFVKRMFSDLQDWYREWYTTHRQKYDDDHVLVKLLEAELVYAQLWTICVALRGCEWDKLPSDQRELAFQAKDAALRCLEIFLKSPNFRAHLKYATHEQLVSVAFAAVFLLKIAILYPQAIPLPLLISQVSTLAHVLSTECFAERYALTLRLMLSNFRRKTGAISTMPGTPRIDNLPAMPEMGQLDSLLTLSQMEEGFDNTWNWNQEESEFDWPSEFSPSNLPVWLQDGNFTDLGLPVDGSDSLFLPPELASMFLPSNQDPNASHQFSFPDSADVGAEAW